jgi:hypothetical protein
MKPKKLTRQPYFSIDNCNILKKIQENMNDNILRRVSLNELKSVFIFENTIKDAFRGEYPHIKLEKRR